MVVLVYFLISGKWSNYDSYTYKMDILVMNRSFLVNGSTGRRPIKYQQDIQVSQDMDIYGGYLEMTTAMLQLALVVSIY